MKSSGFLYRNKVHFATLLLLLFFLPFNASAPQTVYAQGTTYTEPGLNKSFADLTIPAGGTTTLTIEIYNPNSFALILSSSPAALTDTLPADVYFASPANASNTCGGIVSISGTTLSLYGGTVAAQVGTTQGSCQIVADVTSTVPGNHINTIPDLTLKARDPSGTIDLTNPTPASATLEVDAVQPPSISKSFSPNTVWGGQNSTMTIRIVNNDPNHALTEVALSDALPANISIGSFSSSQCGGTVSGTVSSLSLNGASIASGGTCNITAIVSSNTPGIYVNTIPANAVQDAQGVTNSSAASAPLNVQAIGITKAFSPSNFQSGGTSTLTITLQNPSSSAYTGVAFTDSLPGGLIVASPSNASTNCGSGSVTAASGTGTVALSSGTIPAGSITTPGSCTIIVNVTSSTAASYTNTIPAGALTTDQGASNVLPASANISVYGAGLGLGGSKSFSPSSIAIGGNSRLRIQVTAPADTSLTNFSLFDALPTNVTISNSTAASTNGCGTPTLTAATGGTSISLTNGTISAGGTCRIDVYVTSSTPGVYTNTISPANISDSENRNVSGNFSANLTVSGLSVSKAFYPTAVNQNGISTLTITLTNTNSVQLDNVSLSDTLPGNTTNGILIAPSPNTSTTCTGGTVTANPGTQAISLSNGIIPAQVGSVPGICTINVDVIGVGNQATYTNRVQAGNVSGTLHNTTTVITNPQAATANIQVRPITIGVVKSFNPLNVSGGSSSTLSIKLTSNPNGPLAGISFTDSLPQTAGGGMSIADPPNLSVGTCGGTITASPGDTSFTFSGGSLSANSSCTLTLKVVMDVQNNLTNTVGAGAVTSTNGATNPDPASATLTNLGGLTVTKAFEINPIAAGGTSTVKFTIRNLSNFPVTGVGFYDNFPAGLTAVTPLTNPQCGGGTLTWDSGSNRLDFSGGSVASLASCDLTLDVTAASPGTYQNCIEVGALTTDGGETNTTRECDTLTVSSTVLPPSISKSFSPNSIPAGSSSALTFTLTNPPGNTIPLTGVSFTDNLPAGLTVASVPNVSQCSGTVSSTTDSITLTGGSISVNDTCTVTVSITGATSGDYDNTSEAVSSTNGGTGNTASDTLTVVEPPSISKLFAPDTIAAGGTSTLTFTITNPVTNTVALTGVAFTDIFPPGVTVNTAPAVSQCNGGTVSSTTDSITLTGGSIPINSSCTVSVDVTANGGIYDNTSGAVTSTNGGTGNTASDTLTVTGPGLQLDKTTSTAGFQSGGTISYSYILTNTGDTTLDGNGPSGVFTVTDDKATVTCPATSTSLAPTESVTCTATYAVQAADVTARFVTNTATAHALSGGTPVDSNEDSVTVRVEGLTLKKTTSTSGYQTAGTTIHYTYTLTNTGDVTLYAPFEISDDHINGGTAFTCGGATSLTPGANTTCTSTYDTVAGDVTAGSVTNLAAGTARDASSGGSTVTSNQDSVTVYAVTGPSISKSFSPNPISVGGTSILTFTITNPPTNAVVLTGVAFTDTFPSGMTAANAPVSAQCGGSVTYTSNSISLSGGTVLPNSSCTVSVDVTAGAGGSYSNTSGTVSSTNGGDGNTASDTLDVVAPPTISKAFSPTSIFVNGTSTLTFTLENPSGNTVGLTGIGFTDTFPAGVEVANPAGASNTCGGSFSPSPGATTLTFSGGSIAAPGDTCTISLNATATSSGTYYNTTGAISSTEGGTGATSNTTSLTANDAVDLSITKTDGKLAVDRGESVSYQIVVHNAGPSDATGASVSDTVPTSLTGVVWNCTPDAGASCGSGTGNISDTVNIPSGKNITYAVSGTVSNSAANDIINSATVFPPSGLADSDLTNNSATDIDKLNLLAITKGASPTTYSTVGTTINYSYTVTNNGTSTLTNLSVSDDKLTPTCSTPASLAPTESYTCTASHAITQADLDAGSIVNHVHATGTDADTDTVTSNTATRTVTATQTPGLTLAKSITSSGPYDSVGDTISYSYLLTNSGNVTLTGADISTGRFTITDDHIGSPLGTAFTCGAVTSLAPTETVTCTSSYAITQSDLDNGSVTNHANGHGLFNSTSVTSNQAAQTATLDQNPVLALVKSITAGTPYSAVNDTISYSYLLTNNGNVTLTGAGTGGVFTVTDDKATVSCPGGTTSLAPGDSVTCTATYSVTAGDLGSSVTNHATGHALQGTNNINSNQDSQTAVGAPVLQITKDDGLQIVAPDAETEYTITVKNASLQDSTGIVLVDTIPAGTSFVSATAPGGIGWTFDNTGGTVTWDPFDLSAGDTKQFTVKVKVDDGAALQTGGITSITNTVDAQDDGTHSSGTPVQAQGTDTDQIATTNTKTLTGTNQAGSSDPNVLIGEILDYSIQIDIPNGTIDDLKAVDVLDHGLAFVGCDPTTPISSGTLSLENNPCTDPGALTVEAEPVTDTDPASVNAGRHITFDFGQVQNTSGSTQTLTLNYQAVVLDIADNVNGVTGLSNSMEWTWNGGTLPGQATGVDIVEPQLTIEKTVNPAVARLGSTVTYTLDIAHDTLRSTAPAYDVTVTDGIPGRLTLNQASVTVNGSSGLPSPTITTSPTQFSVYWPSFPLGETAEITFTATFVGPSPVVNTANVEWSSLQIDPNPALQPQSTYNQYSTERRYDPTDQTINDYITASSATLRVPKPPLTGFAPGQITALPEQPRDKAYQDLGNFWLEIPRLGVKLPIVGIPVVDGQWDLTWLGEQAGYLDGTAYPTHAGNSAITAHVYMPDGLPGPFVDLHTLKWGDQVIVHLGSQLYIYEVRENKVTSPDDVSIFQHEDYPWLTLITCKDYSADSNTYAHRVTVRAILIKVENNPGR